MKQFILKNIVLVVILALTFVGSIVLIILIVGKNNTINESMTKIDEDVKTLNSINYQADPNSVNNNIINKERIEEDTKEVNKRIDEVYRHFGRPYRPALRQLLTNIKSPTELKTERKTDSRLVAAAEPPSKPETEEAEDGEAEETVVEVTEEQKEAEKKVFDPSNNRVVLSFDEDKLRDMLAEIYAGMQTGDAEDSSDYKIPENIDKQRAEIFMKLFQQMIEPPETVTAANRQAFREMAAEKFAHAFAIFRDDVQELTYEDVTDDVAREIFLDAVGLPREMRQDLCKSYLENIARKYQESNLIPGLPDDDPFEKQRLVRSFIYGKDDPRRNPPADMVIPIIRNIQIKEDLFRRMNKAGIACLESMTVTGGLMGKPLESDSEGRLLVFTYELELTASMDAIDAFINSLHQAYQSDRVYVLSTSSFKLSTTDDDLKAANSVVADHLPENVAAKTAATRRNTATAVGNQPPGTVGDPNAGAFVGQQNAAAQTQTVAASASSRSEYPLTDPHNPDYGRPLIGETRDEVKCTLEVQYLYDTASNITTTP